MPLYEHQCPAGHRQIHYLTLAEHRSTLPCSCGEQAQQVISAPLLVRAAQDVCYDSPIDGQPITSHAQRREDMKRNGCIEYDPEMKTDSVRKLREQESAMDRSIDQQVEQAVEQMPTTQRAKLYSEVTEQGMDLTYHRAIQGA